MSSSPKVCYNPECNNPTPERPRKGWRLKSGDLAALCDRCASTYEEGRFCETFHSRASGWRHCESCGKRIHCGCIISSHVFVLLDSGGVECLMCARKNVVVTSNPAWLPSLIPLSERLKEASMRNWCQSAGSGPMPWRQGSTLFSYSITEPEMLPRVPPEVDKSSVVDKFNISEQFPAPLLEKKTIENFPQKLMNGCLNFGAPEVYKKGKTGNSHGEHHNSCLNISRQCSPLKEDLSIPQFGLTVPCTSANEISGQIGVFGTHSRPSPPSSLTKQLHGNLRSGVDLLGKTQTHYGNSQGYFQGRNQLLSRYWPRITDQELKQISGDSKSVITPLFEKTLSASDAGRIGRLVLPKKCAEAYFPRISQPEGFPLKIQDTKGKEWTFQFRFWPNNNSRMYVLEGVTPCIQSMQLQAGDIVIFSRLEPEGKLVMGFRKGCAAPTNQNNVTAKTGNGVTTTHGDVELADPRSLEKVNEVGCIAKDTLGAKSSVSSKRKNSALVPMSNCLRNENEDLELKLTLEEAQGLLQPPPEHIPSVVVIEGFEFEEYENAPVLGKPRICAADKTGEMVQWVQCEICFKWRKLPANVLLPPRWTCFDNPWDAERSLCSTAQELTSEQLENVLPSGNSGTSKKLKADLDNVEVSEALDGLGNLAVLGYGEAISSSQATTKHPCHRPECSCIQPPNGKGHQHKQTVERREKNQSEIEAQDTREQPRLVEWLLEDDDDDAPLPLSSPFKGQIDLNIQPEREEQVSPGPHPKLLKDCNKQQTPSSSICNLEEISNELSADEVRTATSH